MLLGNDYLGCSNGDSRFFINATSQDSMNKPKQTRRVSSRKLRAAFNDIADMICGGQDRVTLSLSGNTFEIHLENATINISVNESKEGGGR